MRVLVLLQLLVTICTIHAEGCPNWECGIPNALNPQKLLERRNLIVNGEHAEAQEYPFMINLQQGGNPSCGGSIIGRHHVLTAAHCFSKHSHDANTWEVVAADHSTDKKDGEIHFKVKQIILHPNYDSVTENNDIAIIRIKGSFPCDNLHIAPICLGQIPSGKNLNEAEAWVIGWGDTKENSGQYAKTLQELPLRIEDHKQCSKSSKYDPGEVNKNMLCGYGRNTKKATDSCQGDSGGPMFIDLDDGEDHQYLQLGVVSFGQGCAREGFPGVYAKVPEYINWIKSHVDDIFLGEGEISVGDTYINEENRASLLHIMGLVGFIIIASGLAYYIKKSQEVKANEFSPILMDLAEEL